MTKSKKRENSPDSYSDDSEGWATEYSLPEIAQIMNSHESFDTLLFDERLFDTGIFEMMDWLREAWKVVLKQREAAKKEGKQPVAPLVAKNVKN